MHCKNVFLKTKTFPIMSCNYVLYTSIMDYGWDPISQMIKCITSTLLSRQNKRNLCYEPIQLTGVLRKYEPLSSHIILDQ